MAGLQRCTLCQFEISPEDIIEDHEESRYGGLICSSSNTSYFQDLWELHCLKRCHRQCLKMISLPGRYCIWDIAEATKYEYMPSPRQLEIRRRNLRSLISTELLKHYARLEWNLPLELWDIVAEHLIPHFASANLQRLWKPTPGASCASLSRGIWCKYVDFEGTRYISDFSNRPGGDDWELIFQPSLERVVDVYAAENHFGITKLLFSSRHNVPKVDEAEGIWWRKGRVSKRKLSIHGSSDGIKIRRLLEMENDITAWNVPRSNRVRFEHLNPSYFINVPDRMASLVCNRPSIVGYTILWDVGLTKFHAHRRGEAAFKYHSSPYKSWLYMPVDSGEIITEVWLRRSLIRRERALGIKTNTGRVFIAGIYSSRCTSWSLVSRPGPMGEIFFDCSAMEILSLAFESAKPAPPEFPLPMPKPTGGSSPSIIEDYFYSDHDLTGLVRITPCKFSDQLGYSGMILLFSNGHQESVGQIRLDCLCPSMDLERSTPWFLGFKRRSDQHPYVAAITTIPRSSELDLGTVLELSCDGRLEWWWSRHQTYVLYKDQKSIYTR